jgi:putative hydrolase of HD superfamily
MPLLEALLALQPLHDLPRTGWILRGVQSPESIGDHVLSTAFLVLALGPRVTPSIDVERSLSMAVLHDTPEALTGDWPRSVAELLPRGAKHAAEDEAARQLLPPLSGLAFERWQEYRAQSTREARFARICDRLQLGLKLVAYTRAGHAGLEEFQATVRELDCAEFTPAAAFKAEILAAL